jgi:hypothetical protein
MESAGDIADQVFSGLDLSKENVIVIMSNGGFDGIYDRMRDKASGITSRTS